MSNLEQDCEALRKAMKGWGTDDKALIKIIANRTNAYRQRLKVQYKSMYGKDLMEELKSETSGNFEDAIVALFEEPLVFACNTLRKAMKGAGTDEDTLIEVLTSRSNSELRELIAKYKEMFNRDLENDVDGEVSGDLRRILISILQCNRSTNKNPKVKEMEEKAKEIYNAGEAKRGTDEVVFNKVFATLSSQELICMSQQYHKLYGKTILQAIDSEFSGNMKKVYRNLVYALISPAEFFATQINQACKGLGTNDAKLIRIVVNRDEIDLPQIKAIYKQLYNKELIDEIKSECSGSYRNLLIEIIDH